MNSEGAKQSWEILKAVHETPNKQRLETLLRQFYRFEQGSRSIDDSVAYLNGLQADIFRISEKRTPDDYAKALFLLGGLNRDYELIETLLSNELNDDERVDFNGLVARLREEERKRGKSSKDNALLANKGFKDKNKKKDKSKITCYKCQKKGHYASERPEWGQESKEDDSTAGNKSQPNRDGPGGRGRRGERGGRGRGQGGRQHAQLADEDQDQDENHFQGA